MRKKVFAVFMLVCLCLSVQAHADEVEGIEIDKDNFPDEAFRQYVRTHFDTNDDGGLSDSEIAAVTSIPAGMTYSLIPGTNEVTYGWSYDLALPTDIESLEGIGFFVSLDVLGVDGTSITELDTRDNVNLTALICNNNPNLEMLDVSSNTALKYMICVGNGKLQEVDTASNTELVYLKCSYNTLYFLYIPESLVSLDCSYNNLTELDTMSSTALRYLNCSENLISEMDLTENTALKELYCQGNFMIRLDLSKNTNLKGNSITSQDVTGSIPYETDDETYPYAYDFSEMMYDEDLANLSAANIKAYDSNGVPITSSFGSEDEPSVLFCKSEPYKIVYAYKTGRDKYLLNVTLYLDDTNGRIVEEPRFFTPTISTDAYVLANGTGGQTYYDRLAMPKGARPFSYTVTSGDLPEGLSVKSDDLCYGYIDGTPTKTGTFTFTVTASNGWGEASRTYTLTIVDSSYAPTISPDTLPDAWQGISYKFKFSATSSTSEAISWSYYANEMPDGFTLSGDTLTGTPTAEGTYSFTIRAQNSYGDASHKFTLTVNALVLPAITSTTLPVGTVGTYYSADLTATGTPTPTWSVKSGTLPAGLTLNSSSGDITGTPTTAGVFKFTLQAANAGGTASQDFRIIINAEGSPTITTTTLPDGVTGRKYSADLAVSSVVSKDEAVWSLASGDLPVGLSLDTTGVIFGTPTAEGTFRFIVGYTDPTGSASCDLSITVTTITAPTITKSSLSPGTVGVSYTASLSATGTKPITWSKTSGDLPGGLELSTSGDISGTPSTAGTFAFTVQAANEAGTDSADFTITIASKDAPGLPSITTTSLPFGTKGTSYSASLSAEGTKPITWSKISGDLPGGLELSTSGDISGTPTAVGTFAFTVQATNSVGSASMVFTITIAAPVLPGSPTITTTSLPSGVSGTAYRAVLTADGTTPITWSVTAGSLPVGLSLSEAGVISGTPTTANSYKFTVMARNSAGSATRELTLRIIASSSGGEDKPTSRTRPSITTSSVSAGTTGTSYRYSLAASGSTPIIWSLVSGALPAGLRLSSSGVISGTPTESGTFTFVVQARNTVGSISQILSITVNTASSSSSSDVAPSITTSSLPDGTEGTSYTADLKAEGTTPITWSVESGSLPSGLTLSKSGAISGTPSESGIFRFSVNAENSAGKDNKTFTLMIEAAAGPITGTAPIITTTVRPVSGKVKVPYTFTLQAQGTGPIAWRMTDGGLPLGLGLSTNGTISGTPTLAGEYMFGVEAVNEWGVSSATFTIKISPETSEVVKVDDIVRGPARTVDDLSAEDLAEISGDLIAAVMPSLIVNEAGTYTFNINIDASVPVGCTLVWHPFPRLGNDGYGASFTDTAGNTTTTVPSNRRVTVSVYLPQNTYWPVVSARPSSSGGNNNVSPTPVSNGGGGGGGCESFGLGLIGACVLLMMRRRTLGL